MSCNGDRTAGAAGGSVDLPVEGVRVKIDGADLPARVYADLLEVSVQDDVEAPSMFTLRLVTWDDDKLAISWADDDRFAIGRAVEVSMGYAGALAPVMKGEIIALDLEMASGETPTLTVRGYDRRHRLLRGTKTRSFVKMKDSDIAAQIAREQKLSAQVVDSKVPHEYVLQHAQSDLDFLGQRAAAIGYEIVVEDRTLHFRPRAIRRKASISLSMEKDIIEFHPSMTAQNQVGSVDVRGWDPMKKQPIVGKARSAQAVAMGSTLGPKAADKAFGQAALSVVDQAVATQGEADRIALGQLETAALGFIRGEGVCFGRTDVKAGIVVEITGLGKRFSGVYYVSSATHAYSSKDGYRTSFTVRRNAT
ncbi:Phage protein D [Minicystis rosea]|nr:Phage protein D [Minicystis rosea]